MVASHPTRNLNSVSHKGNVQDWCFTQHIHLLWLKWYWNIFLYMGMLMTMGLRSHTDQFIRKRRKQSKHWKNVQSDIKAWMDKNRLHMNSKKTEYITLGSARQLKKNEIRSIDISGDIIAGSTCIRYLGVWADQQLNFKQHIAQKCKISHIEHSESQTNKEVSN